MMEKRCSNCGGTMQYLGDDKIQLGQAGLLLGHLSNLWHGALYVEIWECPECGKLDLYRGEGPREEEGHMAQTVCPNCGAEHDLDDPKCPYCGAKNPNI
ncbi:MAG: zinc-ribbon domain-containing protein [Oscillospiraceae bacterium]|nr:zinc-ribbon domain-containing protein [Oscillospiraceae bacterium]MCI9548875.1 zinc-ribbon domain-containing protein [Oscillospiraceae bacterium]